ncbi:MAG: NAD(P)-dependent oxidoreductase [Flavihumibacter sp.]
MRTKQIGWIGTGLMGLPMAKHLIQAGHKLNIHTRTREKAKELLELGSTWYDDAAALAADSDLVITMIGSPKEVEDCYFGERGIFKTVKPGSIVVDMTTTKPSLAKTIATEAAARQCKAVDAPVSGGQVGAINGSLSIMIGGEKEIVDQLMPIFQAFGKNMVYQGPAGAGQHTKLCNQITIAGTLIGVCEGLIYGRKAGLDLSTMLESISKGAAGCWSLDILAPKIVKGDMSPGFSVDNFTKDLRIALEEADAMKLSLPGLALVKQLYLTVIAMGHGASGNQALYLAIENVVIWKVKACAC